MSHRTRRWGALVAASALTLSGIALAASPASAVPAFDPHPGTVGADWLAGQLTNGLMHNPNYGGFDDYGLSIDAGFALEAVGGHAGDVADISTALAAAIGSYVTGEPYDAGSTYAGPTAKAAVFADLAGADPTSYGGKDLVAALEGTVSTTAPITGRIVDTSTYGDYANVIGQSFAVNALHTAGSTKEADALAFLLKQQCAAGYFRLYMTTDKTADDQTCEGGRAAGKSNPDPDATSTAIRMLLPQIDSSAAVARAIGKAESWLLGQQRADGSFGGGTSTSPSNANSTGLAGWALGLLGDTGAATDAAGWLRGLQADEIAGCANGLTTQTGAIGYNDAGVAAGLTDSITDSTSDQWRRATVQGLPALVSAAPVTPAVTLQGPAGYVKAGSSVSYLVTGAVPGEKVCLTGSGAGVRGVAGANGNATLRTVAPAGTANRVVQVADRSANTAQTTTKVLGAKTLRIVLGKSRARRGHTVQVTVTGLASGERTTLRFRGVTVRTGSATASGTFVATINVGRRLGNAAVVAWGQFPTIRHGRAVITVVR